ncbi:SIS domain-containing protein [Microcoleus sp. T2B6]|uniref:SIS domain-containing protein n=1 Tax=Microcoleus sp. T2B6 TaxID=3055424 RepID=UPI002FD486C7
MQTLPSQLAFATDYFRQLASLSETFEVSDRQSQPLSFDEGISRAAALVRKQTQQQKKVIFIGNGGSAAVASHQAIDYWRNGGFPAMAFNDGALLTCISNDFGYEQVFSKPIATFAQPGDIVFAISSSGQSANILAGANQANQMGCYVITLSAFEPDNPLRQLGNLNFYVPTMAYGFAEITHLCICHCILDGLMKGALPEADQVEETATPA